MTTLPQSNNLQEIQRAILSLETRLLRRIEGSGNASASVAKTRGGVAIHSNAYTPSTPSVVVTETTPLLSVQTLRLQTISMDPDDDLPLTDEDDCAVIGVQEVPILIDPMQELRFTAPAAGGTVTYVIPNSFDPLTSFINIVGEHLDPLRIETVLDAPTVFVNTASENGDGTVVIALLGADPADPGVTIDADHVAWIQEKDDDTGLELVIYYA
jgi:hypothetical protein